MQEFEGPGAKRTHTNRLGYVGDRIDHLFYGHRGEELMVIASSEVAAKYAPFFLGMATRITRLDLQVTLQDDDVDRDWTEIALSQCSMDGRVDSGLLKTRRIAGTPDGVTLYIGSRSSDRFIRIYDKTAESNGVWPERSWRWEIEYKKARATMVAGRFLRAGATDRAIQDIVSSAVADIRIQLPYGETPSGWLPKRPKLLTSDESRLVYASRVIGPFVQRLVEAVGEDRVKEALGSAKLGRSYSDVKPKKRYVP